MARHQVSMTQTNKIVSVVECPKEIDDDVPVLQLIQQLESRNLVSTVLPRNTNKVILPLIWKIDSDIPEYLMGDSMRITQILLNLCSNALKVVFFFLFDRKALTSFLSQVYKIRWYSSTN